MSRVSAARSDARCFVEPLESRRLLTAYYVDDSAPAGGDGLSVATAWNDLSYAVGQVAADEGHNIYIKAGTYIENTVMKPRRGVNILGEGADKVTLTGTGGTTHQGTAFFHIDDTYGNGASGGNRISGFTIDGGTSRSVDNGIFAEGRNYVEIDNMRLLNLRKQGLHVSGRWGTDWASYGMVGMSIHDNYLNHCGGLEVWWDSQNSRWQTNWNGGAAILFNGWTGGEIYNNTIVNDRQDASDLPSFDGHGIKGGMYGHGTLRGVKVRNNTITVPHLNQEYGANFGIELFYGVDGTEIYENTVRGGGLSFVGDAESKWQPGAQKVYRNKLYALDPNGESLQAIELTGRYQEVYDNYAEGYGNFISNHASSGTTNGSYSNTIHHNVFRGTGTTKGGAFISFGGAGGTGYRDWNVYHNTIDSTQYGIQAVNAIPVNDLDVRNNVFMNVGSNIWNHASASTVSDISFAYNLFYNRGGLQNDGSAAFANNIDNTSPGLKGQSDSGLTRPSPYYEPSGSSSGVVNRGVTITGINDSSSLFPASGTPDLGRYEHAASLPAGWTGGDVGAVAAAGSSSESGGTWTVTGSGNDIWNAADEFRFVYRTLEGDGELIARVASQQNTDPWAKAGVMVRESLAAGSRNVAALATPSNGTRMQYRSSTGGTTTGAGAGNSNKWVRVVRSGSTVTAYQSANGTSWAQIGSAGTVGAGTLYIGLAVTSHKDGTLSTANFADVQLIDRTLLSERFDSSAANWSPSTGSAWSVQSGQYQGSSTSTTLSTAGQSSWSNYSVEARITPTTLNADSNFSLIARYIDADRYYYFHYSHTARNWQVWKYSYGTKTSLGTASGTFNAAANTTYTVKAVVNGSSLQLYVNGSLMASASDSSYGSGKVGLRLYNATVRFDDVIVRSLA